MIEDKEMAKERLSAIQDSCDAHAEMTGHEDAKLIKKGRTMNILVEIVCDDCGSRLGNISVSNADIIKEAAEELPDFDQLHKEKQKDQ